MSGPKEHDPLLLIAAGLLDELDQGGDGSRAAAAIIAGIKGGEKNGFTRGHLARTAVAFALKVREAEQARRQYNDGTGEAAWLAIMRARETSV
jgi:hypothetical protein